MKTKRQSFLSGAFTLMISSIMVRLIGAFFKVPLAAMLGGEGMGYYMTAYTVMGPAFALCVMGISISVSKLCASVTAKGKYYERENILFVAMVIFSIIAFSLMIIIYSLSPILVKIIENQASIKAVKAMIPAILFCCISSVFRGYYEGVGNMVPTAVSQIAESVAKMMCGLLFSWLSLKKITKEYYIYGTVRGVAVDSLQQAMSVASPNIAAAAVMGVAVSTAVGSIVAAIFYFRYEKNKVNTTVKYMNFTHLSAALIRTAFPISAAALVINMTSLMDVFTVMNRISRTAQENWHVLCQSRPELALVGIEPNRAANYLYGIYTGMSMTVFNLAPAFTSSIAICALPMISSLYSQGKKYLLISRIESVLRITMIAAFPIGLGMSAMAEPIINTLFSASEYEAIIAADLLKTLGIASIFVAISGVVNSMLQAVGRIYVPLKLLICGAAIKLLINYIFISYAQFNISGAPWGTLFCYLFIMLAGIAALMRTINADIDLFPMMFKPALAAVGCCFGSVLVMKYLEKIVLYPIATVLSIFSGAVIYITFLVILKGFGPSELELLDNNSKINKLLFFCGIIPCKSHCNAVK